MFKRKYYIKPPKITIANSEYYIKGYSSYSDYNYLRPGIASSLKIEHFEIALRLAEKYFSDFNVIDFGCADGPFLPSLSRYFNQVIGIDINQDGIYASNKLVDELNLKNVELICNKNLKIDQISSHINEDYNLLFLLETLEHVGNKNSLYESKIDFINDLFKLINKDGIIIISVPKMVGFSFLFQRIGFATLGLDRAPISMKNLIKASILNDTSELEIQWNHGHIGFNHTKLEKYLESNFKVLKKKNGFFHVVYMIKQS